MRIEKLNGGSAELKAGDTVTPKPDAPAEYRKWSEYRVESIRAIVPEFDGAMIYAKAPDGTQWHINNPEKNLLLTTSSELQALAQLESIREMVKALEKANYADEQDGVNDLEAQKMIEAAHETIQEDPLSVEARSPWISAAEYVAGDKRNFPGAAEFKILLCTGGPAVQIIGELSEHAEPESVRLQHQDWGTPWTDVLITAEDQETLLAYCRCFYFGE